MPQEIDEQDNTGLDVEQLNEDGSNDSVGGDNDEDFLVVNERTRFKNADDAIKSFNEAGQRIAQLSGWEKEIKERFGVSDPQTAAALLQELVDRRAEAANAAKEAAKAKEKPATAATTTSADEVLTQEDADALKWLKKHAPRLGFVPKDELTATVDALKQQIEELRTGSTQSAEMEQERVKSERVDAGREAVRGWMAEQKIAADPEGEKQLVIESLIRDWVNSDNERVRRFYESGSSAKQLIKEGFDKAVKVLGWGKTAVNPSSAAYAQSKGQAMARNGKKLPQNGQARRTNGQKIDQSNVRRDASGKRDYIAEAHNAAFDLANKHFSGHSSE
jgi:hypothetical protein